MTVFAAKPVRNCLKAQKIEATAIVFFDLVITLVLITFWIKDEAFQDYKILHLHNDVVDKKYFLIGMPISNDGKNIDDVPSLLFNINIELLLYLLLTQVTTFTWLKWNLQLIRYINKMRKQETFGYDMNARPTL